MTSIIPYTPSLKETMEALIQDPFVRADLERNLPEHEDCCLLLVEEEKVLGGSSFHRRRQKDQFHPLHSSRPSKKRSGDPSFESLGR